MQIQSTMPQRSSGISQPKVQVDKTAEPGSTESTPKDSFHLSAEEVVTKGAFAAGGALGGVGLGVVTGSLMNSLTGSKLSSTLGGTLGGVGGAITALAVSGNENKAQSMVRVFGGWTGSSAGALAGQFVGDFAQGLTALGASAWIGAAGPLAGTAVGALAGASIPLAGADGKVANLVKDTALAGLAGGGGIALGSFAEIAAHQVAPALGPVASVGPLLAGLTTGSIALAIKNEGPLAIDIAAVSIPTSLSFAAGMFGGVVASKLGASDIASMAIPAAATLTAGLNGYASLGDNDRPGHEIASKAAVLTATTGFGTTIGDLAGSALTAVTGHGIYKQAGAIAGATNGALAGLSLNGVNTLKAGPSVIGATAGTATGALLGAALSRLTGQGLWGIVMPALGAAAGGLSGAAAAFQAEKTKAAKSES